MSADGQLPAARGSEHAAREAQQPRAVSAISRRGLLRAGVFGSAAVSLGGVISCSLEPGARSQAASGRVALTSQGEEILRAVGPIILADLLSDLGERRESVVESGLAGIDDYIAHLSLPLQQELGDLFATLDLWPVRVLLTGQFARWADASPEAIEAFLRGAKSSSVLLLRRVYTLLQSLVVLSFFDQPAAWKSVGYPGPLIDGLTGHRGVE